MYIRNIIIIIRCRLVSRGCSRYHCAADASTRAIQMRFRNNICLLTKRFPYTEHIRLYVWLSPASCARESRILTILHAIVYTGVIIIVYTDKSRGRIRVYRAGTAAGICSGRKNLKGGVNFKEFSLSLNHILYFIR